MRLSKPNIEYTKHCQKFISPPSQQEFARSARVINPLLSRTLHSLNIHRLTLAERRLIDGHRPKRTSLERLVVLLLLATIAFTPVNALAKGMVKGQRPFAVVRHLQIKVKDPGCPACLKTLSNYLLKMPGVKSVRLPTLTARHGNAAAMPARPPQQVDIWYVSKTVSRERLIERVKQHDLEIVQISNVEK